MILILGVGNEMRGDDAFGPLVVKMLRKEISDQKSVTIWFGDTPENYITKIREPVDTLIVIDTAFIGKKSGTVELLDPDRITGHVSTHKLPLSLLINHLKPAKTWFIAAQPQNLEFGANPSKEILEAVKRAKKMALEIIKT